MKYTTPEKVGISSVHIKDYIDLLEANEMSTHNLIIAKGDEILFEKYWEPFHADYNHRMYSVTKSVVALGIGFAMQDGLLALDDTVEKHFPKEIAASPCADEKVKRQTIRNMLMMSTARTSGGWFSMHDGDRVQCYFSYDRPTREPGVLFEYDSCGSFVLCALVERLTGKRFMDYMREKLFDKIGVSKEADMLECPGGHSWGDSALICKPKDLLLIARFVMNQGKWNGEQLLDAGYVKDATSKLIETKGQVGAEYQTFGYGYQIWQTYDNSFAFYGMGCQYALCIPEKDIICIYNGDNQGYDHCEQLVIENFFKCIARKAVDGEIAMNEEITKAKEALEAPLKLMVARGMLHTNLQDSINHEVFKMQPNPMGIKEFSIDFETDCCYFNYINDQGAKRIPFGMGENVFDVFPQEGYADRVGGVWTKGHYYRCATSGAWLGEKKLHLKVQIVDKYFGRMDIFLEFDDEKNVKLSITKRAEYFLDEYVGNAIGERGK